MKAASDNSINEGKGSHWSLLALVLLAMLIMIGASVSAQIQTQEQHATSLSELGNIYNNSIKTNTPLNAEE